MSQIKNIIILGASLIFMVMFWSIAQFFHSLNLIEQYKSSEASSSRGYAEATQDIKNGQAKFKRFNGAYPPITQSQLEGVYKDYVPGLGIWCGTVSNSFENIALNLRDYGYNDFYVTSYNATLISLIDNERGK